MNGWDLQHYEIDQHNIAVDHAVELARQKRQHQKTCGKQGHEWGKGYFKGREGQPMCVYCELHEADQGKRFILD